MKPILGGHKVTSQVLTNNFLGQSSPRIRSRAEEEFLPTRAAVKVINGHLPPDIVKEDFRSPEKPATRPKSASP